MLIIVMIALLLCVVPAAYLSFLSAQSTGWRDLAAAYRWRQRPPRHRVGFQSASLNDFAFPLAMTLGVSERGLFLKLAGLSLLFHPPLLIPWRKLRREPFHNPFTSGTRLTIPGERFKLEFSQRTQDTLAQFVDDAWHDARAVLPERTAPDSP